jgi:hypothetical protein
MKKWILVFSFILASSPAFAARVCVGDLVAGVWKNGYGNRFQLLARDCDHVDVIDLAYNSRVTYALDLRGNFPARVMIGDVKFDLKPTNGTWNQYGGSEEATLMWKIAPQSLEVSPGLGIKVTVYAFDGLGTGQINTLEPHIDAFVSQPGDLGNLFDEGVSLVVKMLNHFNIGKTLTEGAVRMNTLHRVR